MLQEFVQAIDDSIKKGVRGIHTAMPGKILVYDADKGLATVKPTIYYSEYPSSAEGVSLDNASQYGGTTREGAAKSYYPIHCTGKDGTLLTAGTGLVVTGVWNTIQKRIEWD